MATGVDLLPSLCAIAGVELPEGYRSDGVDLSRELLGKAATTRGRPIVWEYNAVGGNIVPSLKKDRSRARALRNGDWKLLVDADGTGTELYNLATDRDESESLTERYPRRTRRMRRRLFTWYRGLPELVGDVERPRPTE